MALFSYAFVGRIREIRGLKLRLTKQWASAAPVLSSSSFLTCSCSTFVLAVLKVVYGAEGALIGHNLGSTFAFLSAIFGLEGGIIAVAMSMSHATESGQTPIFTKLPAIAQCAILFSVVVLLMIVSKVLLIAMAVQSSPSTQDKLFVGFVICTAVYVTASFFLAWLHLNAFIGVLNSSMSVRVQHADKTSIQQTSTLRDRMLKFRRFAVPQFLIHPISVIFCAFWPFFRSKAAYSVVLIALFLLFLGAYAILLVPKRKSKRLHAVTTLTSDEIH
eukprot:c20337_g1_i2.p1 GENE.c20337_g1_i2~~c20337_g1_i2.p1  ORF type:complete len:274 (+),score=48.07 c20337_g1_i2:295-1116(+)